MDITIKSYLEIPIFSLYNFKQIDKIEFGDGDKEYLKNSYNLKERKAIHDSLNWAKNNPNFEFESIMENAPVVGKLPFSNSKIYEYLMRFKTFMEEDNGLLSEESNTKY
jgi:hypothetical protein